MIKDNVEAVPRKIWEWGISNCSGALKSFPEDVVKLAVMPTAKANVTEKGIKFKGAFYSSDKAVRELWFEKARSGKTRQVTVSYDPHDMTDIYIWNKDDKTYDICTLLGQYQRVLSKSAVRKSFRKRSVDMCKPDLRKLYGGWD
jgi:hypothetical protein